MIDVAVGAFGVVSLVKEKSTGQLFAMKQVRFTVLLSEMRCSCPSSSAKRICSARARKATSAPSATSSNQPRWSLPLDPQNGSSGSTTASRTGIICTWSGNLSIDAALS